MTNKKSYMSTKNILSEGMFDKLIRKLKLSKLAKDKKIIKSIDDLNIDVLDLEDDFNKRFKELDPKYKPIKLSKYKLSDFI